MPKTTLASDNTKSLLTTYGLFGGLLISAVSFAKLVGEFNSGPYDTFRKAANLRKTVLEEAITYTKFNRSSLGLLATGAGVTLYSAHDKISKLLEPANDQPQQIQLSR